MNRFRVIPVLLLKNEGLVKTIKFKDPNYIGDPLNAVKLFNEKEVDELVLLDISVRSKGATPNFQMIEEVASECFMPLCYGGGVNTLHEIKKLFSIGIEKVSLNTLLHTNPAIVSEAVLQYGSQSIIASIDIKRNFFGRYEVYTNSGKNNTKLDPIEFAIQVQKLGVGEILLNSIDRDGLMNGYDIDIISKITSNIDIPLIACGGAGSLQHMHDAITLAKASAVAAGSFFVYHGKHKAVLINYPKQEELKKIYE
jgi:cyclase